MAISFNLI